MPKSDLDGRSSGENYLLSAVGGTVAMADLFHAGEKRHRPQRWVHCSEDDGVRITADYEVVVDETAGTLQAIGEPCGELRVRSTETSDEVQMTVSLIGGGVPASGPTARR